MKTKFLLPICAAALSMSMFAACSDDSSSPSTPVVDPGTSVTDPTTDPTVTDPTVTDPTNQIPTDPTVTDPTVTDPTIPDPTVTDPTVVDPASSSSVVIDPTAPLDANGLPTSKIFDDSALPKLDNNDTIHVENKKDYDYYGAELTGKDQFQYGRFEARMKMVSISGSVSSMFLYYDNSYMLADEPWNEIDIEVLGKNPGAWQSNIITRYPDGDDGKKNKNITSEYVHQFGDNATENFHLYAMIWTPEYIAWEIDSVEIRRDYVGQAKGQVEFMTMEQSLRFNLWSAASAAWVGKFTGGELADGPKEQLIDYVRVYSYDQATKTFALDWQDDFEGTALDKSHWRTGDWKMENVTLRDENVVVEDGYCKLRLSRELKVTE